MWLQEEVDFWTGPDPPFENDQSEEDRAFLVDTFIQIYEKARPLTQFSEFSLATQLPVYSSANRYNKY